MKRSQRREARRALGRRVGPLVGLPLSSPSKGWVRGVRDALGLSARQLAERLGVSTASVAKLEVSERSESAQLSTLRRAAEAMDCDLVYAFVPRTDFGDIVRQRANDVARHELVRVNISMGLEGQACAPVAVEEMVRSLASQLVDDPSLWNARDGLGK